VSRNPQNTTAILEEAEVYLLLEKTISVHKFSKVTDLGNYFFIFYVLGDYVTNNLKSRLCCFIFTKKFA
jgi:hypothetical protein